VIRLQQEVPCLRIGWIEMKRRLQFGDGFIEVSQLEFGLSEFAVRFGAFSILLQSFAKGCGGVGGLTRTIGCDRIASSVVEIACVNRSSSISSRVRFSQCSSRCGAKLAARRSASTAWSPLPR